MIRSDRESALSRDLGRAWARAFDGVPAPEYRLRAALALARTLLDAERAIVFDEESVLAATPGERDALAARRLFERARRAVGDETVTGELYVARIAAGRAERLAIRWRAAPANRLEIARAIAVTCAFALGRRAGERAPAGLPDGGATLRRLEQLIHGAQRMKRPFAVVYVDVEASPAAGESASTRDAVALRLRREVRANDHLGHLGGDAYIALVALEAGEAEAYPAAARLLRAAAASSPDAGANVGVAICPDDGVHPQDLVEKAGAAALAAASVGGVRPYWYREPAGRRLSERASRLARLREGDPAAVVELRFEPVFAADTRRAFAAAARPWWRATSEEAARPASLDDVTDRVAREVLERWTIANAAGARRTWSAAGIGLDLYLALSPDTIPAAVDERSAAMLVELAEGAADDETLAAVRRMRGAHARAGIAIARAAQLAAGEAAFDFVTVRDEGSDVAVLAELARACVVAPLVVASGVRDAERARWLVRHGASALYGEGLAAPMPLHELVRWASDRGSSVAW